MNKRIQPSSGAIKVLEPECVKMKRRASLRIHKMLSKMTREEVLAYWDRRVTEMQEDRKKAREKAGK